jgi:peptide/nickel transport system permease protein
MLAYCLKRIVAGALVLFALSVAVFAMVYLAPGSVEHSLLGAGARSPEAVAAVRAKYHLDEPFLRQYGYWIGGVVKGDFGDSIKYRESATATIGTRAVVTAQLAALAFGFSLLLGMGLGVLAAVRSRTALDRVLVGSSIIGTSVPTFILGVLLIYVFSVQLGWFPVSGPGTGGLDRLWHLVLPALTLGFSSYALVLKLTRAGVLNNMEQDAFLFARARGVRGWLLMRRYGLRAGLIPLVTSLALLLAYMLTGAVLVEVVFGIPGLASLLVESVNGKDVPVIQALTLLTGVIVITLNLVADISYRLIDPRVRVSETSP